MKVLADVKTTLQIWHGELEMEFQVILLAKWWNFGGGLLLLNFNYRLTVIGLLATLELLLSYSFKTAYISTEISNLKSEEVQKMN